MTGYIFLAGDVTDYSIIGKCDVTICADGGYKHAENIGFVPNYIVGDMDSIGKLPTQPHIIQYPTDKDYTDGQLAVKFAAEELKCDEVIIFGALNKGSSSRFDHVLGNVYLLKLAQSLGMTAKILEPDCEVILINKSAEIERKNYKYISFLPLSPTVNGLTLTGVKYPLTNAKITQSDFITMSNEFADDVAFVKVKKGELLAILCKA